MSLQSAAPLFQIDVRQWLRGAEARRPFPNVSEPHEVACYSTDEDGRLNVGSRHKLRKFVDPPRNVDLNDGFDTFVPKRHDDTSIRTVIHTVRTQNATAFNDDCDIITYRNNLNKIGKTPLSQRDAWELDCCQIGTKVALDIRMTDMDPVGDNAHRRAMYQGYRFEAVCTDDTDNPVNPNADFCSISALRLGHHRLIVSSEIDCTFGDPQKPTEFPIRDYVELKTIKASKQDRDLNNLYRHRYPKFWLQSYFAGVPTIIIGHRHADGKLVDVSSVETSKMPTDANRFLQSHHSRSWNPAVMLIFIDYVLELIRTACANDLGSTIRLEYTPADCSIRAFLTHGPDSGLSQQLADSLKG